MKDVLPGDSVHSLLSILDIITVSSVFLLPSTHQTNISASVFFCSLICLLSTILISIHSIYMSSSIQFVYSLPIWNYSLWMKSVVRIKCVITYYYYYYVSVCQVINLCILLGGMLCFVLFFYVVTLIPTHPFRWNLKRKNK